MKMAANTKYAMVSLIIAWLVYDIAIMSFCFAKSGTGVVVEAIWGAPRFRSALGWYVLAQVLVVLVGAGTMRLMFAKAWLRAQMVVLVLFHSGLALVSAVLGVVCDGAIWKTTDP
jgi:hypothetical protein